MNSRQKAKEEYEAKQAEEKAKIQAAREAAAEALADSQDGTANIIRPKYKYDERLKVDVEVE